MHITLTHNTPNVSLATLEIDLEGLDRYDYAALIEEWQDQIREDMGYDGGAEKPIINYLMVSYEDIPDRLMANGGPSRAAWDYLEAMASDRNNYAPEVYWAAEALDIPASDVEEAYVGSFNSDEEFAQNLADDLGLVPDDLSWPCNCISWPDAARELMMSDYCAEDGWYFRNL